MHPEAWVADKVKALPMPQDGKCVLVQEHQDPVIVLEDDNVIDIVIREKLDSPLNLKPRSTDRGLRLSEMPMRLEAWAITDMTDLTVEQQFDDQGYVVR